jgi:hypothetical protein
VSGTASHHPDPQTGTATGTDLKVGRRGGEEDLPQPTGAAGGTGTGTGDASYDAATAATTTPQDPVTAALAERDLVRVLLVARWSPPCLLMRQAGLDSAADVVLDVDDEPGLVERYQVWSLPTLLIVDAGGVRRRVTGAACVDELGNTGTTRTGRPGRSV